MNSVERFALGVSNCRSAADVVASVVNAEQLGAEIAFIAEDVGCRDAFVLASLAATETRQIRLSTGVANPYTRNPMALATAAATLDETSQGRAGLGLGSSSWELIEHHMGIGHAGTSTTLREAVEIVRALLGGGEVTYEGKRFRFRDARMEVPPVQEHIPIYLGAMGPDTLMLAGQMADGVLLNVGASPSYVRWAVERIVEGARAVGRDPMEVTIAAWLSVYFDDDRAAAIRRARPWLATMLSIPRQGELLLGHGGFDASILGPIRAHVSGYPHSGDPEAAGRFIPDEVVEGSALVGDVDAVRARLAEYRASGVQVAVMGPSALARLL